MARKCLPRCQLGLEGKIRGAVQVRAIEGVAKNQKFECAGSYAGVFKRWVLSCNKTFATAK
jgi:hypothetical protein